MSLKVDYGHRQADDIKVVGEDLVHLAEVHKPRQVEVVISRHTGAVSRASFRGQGHDSTTYPADRASVSNAESERTGSAWRYQGADQET